MPEPDRPPNHPADGRDVASAAVVSEGPGGWKRVLRRVLLGIAVAIVASGAIVATTGLGMGAIVPWAIARALPDGWTVEVGAVSGRWLARVELQQLALQGPGTSLEVDRLRIAYRVRPLLEKAVVLDSVTASAPAVRLEPTAERREHHGDSVSVFWRLLAGRPVGAWSVRVDAARMVDGAVDMALSGEGTGQGHYSLRGLTADAGVSLGADGLSARLDHLGVDFTSELSTDGDSVYRSQGRIEARGSLADGTLHVATLSLESGSSRLFGGGRVSFVARPEPVEAADLSIEATPLDLRDLPLVLPEPLRESPQIRAALSVRGPPDSLAVEARIDAFEGRTHATAEARVRADAQGRRSAEGTVDVRGLDLSSWSPPPTDGTLGGALSFFAEADGPRVVVDGVVTHEPRTPDASRLTHRPLRIELALEGRRRGTTPEGSVLEAEGEATIHTAAGARPVGRLNAALLGQAVRWSVDLALDSGSVAGAGTVDWTSTPTTVVERLEVDRLDLRAVDAAYPETRVTGSASGRVGGAGLDDARGSVRVSLRESSFGGRAIDSLRLGAEIRGRTAEGRLATSGELGTLRSAYEVELRSDTALGVVVTDLRYEPPASDTVAFVLGETVGRARATWALGQARRGTLDALIDSARVRGAWVRGATVSASLDGERVQGSGEATVDSIAPSPVRLTAELDLRGISVGEAVGVAQVRLRRPHLDDAQRVDSAQADLDVDAGRLGLVGSFWPAAGGRLTARGRTRVAPDSLAFEVEIGGRFDEPVALLDGGTLDSVQVVASGRREGDAWQNIDAEVGVDGARWRTLVADRARASIRLDGTGLTVDSLHVSSNVGQMSGHGALHSEHRDGRIEVVAEITDLEPIRILTGRELLAATRGTVVGAATGTVDSVAWGFVADVEALVVDRIRMTGLRADASGTLEPPRDRLGGLRSATAEIAVDRLELPSSEVRRVDVSLGGGPDSVRVSMEALVDDRRSASLRMQLDPRPDRRTARIDDLRFQIDDDTWTLAQQATLSYGAGIMVEPVLLRAREQEIRVEGGITEDRAFDLNARMDSTDVGTVADLIGVPRLRGWLTGRVRLQGPVSAPEAWVDMTGAFHRDGRPPGPVELRVRADGRRVRTELRLRDARDGSLRVAGGAVLPEAGSSRPAAGAWPDGTIVGMTSDSLDVTLEAQTFDVRWLEAFFTAESLASLQGELDGALTLTGSTGAPELGGALGFRNGSARPTPLGVRWDAVAFTLRGDGPLLRIDSARVGAADSEGSLTASGTVGITGPMRVDLSVSMRDFQAMRTDAFWATVSGTVGVRGTARAPELSGSVRLESLDVFLDERVTAQGLEQVELTDDDLRMLRERFGVVPELGPPTRRFSERVTADLEVFFGRDSWMRKRTSPEMAVPFSGTIGVALRPGQPPVLDGSVEVIEGRGYVEQFGRRFDLTEGTVVFNGPPEATRIDLTASYTIPSRDNPDAAEVTILLDVEGTQDDLGLTLSSDPQLENADIVSYIATGRPAAGSLSFEDGGGEGDALVAAGAGYALSQMTSLIENAAARSVGLDVIEIRREGLRQATLVAGKYLSPRLYVGFAQPVSLQEGDGLSLGSESQSELEIEYELLRWLIANVEGSGSSLRFFLRARRAY